MPTSSSQRPNDAGSAWPSGLADRTPSWCVLHELAHAMRSQADGRSDGHGPVFTGVYIRLIVRYVRLDPQILIDSLQDARIEIVRGARPVFVDPGPSRRHRHKPPQGPDFRRRVNSQRTPQQSPRGHDIVERQTVDGRVDQHLTLVFHPFHRLKLGTAPTTRLDAVQRGAAERTALHRSGLE